jgi:hypothetical protein
VGAVGNTNVWKLFAATTIKDGVQTAKYLHGIATIGTNVVRKTKQPSMAVFQSVGATGRWGPRSGQGCPHWLCDQS